MVKILSNNKKNEIKWEWKENSNYKVSFCVFKTKEK